ncbi:hypothetical protein DPMN_056912 [Dreissena polymorpha]|uniref:Uncharacterized protein n=1 Tax=Dreissena polymorpha TaxID=45954 RepID=A0A9D4CUM5_DREPO|nr:hypothetical protein DPMN_056912 [Dreissena polymorpha]
MNGDHCNLQYINASKILLLFIIDSRQKTSEQPDRNHQMRWTNQSPQLQPSAGRHLSDQA